MLFTSLVFCDRIVQINVSKAFEDPISYRTGNLLRIFPSMSFCDASDGRLVTKCFPVPVIYRGSSILLNLQLL